MPCGERGIPDKPPPIATTEAKLTNRSFSNGQPQALFEKS